jgi:hypothetical protein
MHRAFLSCAVLLRRGIVLGCVMLCAAGCMSSRYKMAATPKPTDAAPVILNLTVEEGPVAAVVQSVIIFHGPGAWKKEAYWDEYLVAIANRGSTDLIVDRATLVGLPADARSAAVHPWLTEKASRSALDYNFGLAKNVAVQIGGGFGTVLAAMTVGGVIAPAGFLIPAGAAVGFVVAVPVAIGGTIYRNFTGRRKVEAEFARRRLALPLTIKPGETVQGSLFFTITPGPRQLSLAYTTGGEARTVSVDLAPLAGLHLRPSIVVRVPAVLQ